ncbi:hypothetical protein NESM_000837900 [Novymonas esmeraldas]|uniref:Surface antigen-like protein n=1 Tax=Novymonas esmeraldas TaxID=1808958 RepID=A0AAW0F0N1_9TRYP
MANPRRCSIALALIVLMAVASMTVPGARAQTATADSCSSIVPFCRKCYDSPSYPCMDCIDGYARTSQGRCVAGAPCEVANCVACPKSTTHCTTCAAGYHRAVSGKCVSKVYGPNATSPPTAYTTALVLVVMAVLYSFSNVIG